MIFNNSRKINKLICCDIGDGFGGGFGAGDGVAGDMGGFGGFGGGGFGGFGGPDGPNDSWIQQKTSQSNFPPAQYVQPGPTTLEGSAMANIDLQKAQLAKIEELTAPYRQAGINTALPNLSALAFGGNLDYQPSQLYNQQLSQGRQGILRSQAGGGAGVKSSRTFERLADLVSGLAGEDLGRYEQNNQTLLNQGITATNQLGQAGSQLTGNVSNIYSNLGQGLNNSAQQQAQSQYARGQTLNSGLQGLSQLVMSPSISSGINSFFGGN